MQRPETYATPGILYVYPLLSAPRYRGCVGLSAPELLEQCIDSQPQIDGLDVHLLQCILRCVPPVRMNESGDVAGTTREVGVLACLGSWHT